MGKDGSGLSEDGCFSSLWSALTHTHAALICCVIKHLGFIYSGEVLPADVLFWGYFHVIFSNIVIVSDSCPWKHIDNKVFIQSRAVRVIAAILVTVKQIFSARQKMTNKVTRPHPINTKQAINPTNHESTVELAGSRFASDCPHFGSGAFWRENMWTSGGSRHGLALHDGRTSAWKLHYVPAVGLAVALSKTTLAGCCSWQIQCGLFEARLFIKCFAGKPDQEPLAIKLCCFTLQCECAWMHEHAELNADTVTKWLICNHRTYLNDLLNVHYLEGAKRFWTESGVLFRTFVISSSVALLWQSLLSLRLDSLFKSNAISSRSAPGLFLHPNNTFSPGRDSNHH